MNAFVSLRRPLSRAPHPAGDNDVGWRPMWGLLTGVAGLSALVNILYLTGSLFMLEVYDRVLPSRSIPTLLGLAAIALVLYAFQGWFDVMRGRLLVRAGVLIEQLFGRRSFEALVQTPFSASADKGRVQPLQDLDQVRNFLSGMGPGALCDLPWIPFYIILLFAFHVWIGVAALFGAMVLVGLAIATEALMRGPSRRAGEAGLQRHQAAEAARRNAEVLRAMGMTQRAADVWCRTDDGHSAALRRAADVAGGFGSVTRIVRFVLQSLVLGIGAYLVITNEATAGIMIASSILVARALAPVELTVANWKNLVSARESWKRLQKLASGMDAKRVSVTLPQPRASLTAESLSILPPGGRRLVLQDVSLALRQGQGLGIVGPSGSGKSSLARALVGVWPPVRGKVRLDGAALDRWSPDELGRHIGYLPQDIELFAGTVAQNIARFEPRADSEGVIAAARAAGVHEMICRLEEGYDTQIGEGGLAISGGERQRIGLARALYGEPFLVVLDEPSSNLDAEGEEALIAAVLGVRGRGGIVVLAAHRRGTLAAVDQVLVLGDGRVRALGAKEQVLKTVAQPSSLAEERSRASVGVRPVPLVPYTDGKAS